MKKELFRPIIEAAIKEAEEEGLDLALDSMERNFVLPEHPKVLFSFRIGGMFTGMEYTGEEH